MEFPLLVAEVALGTGTGTRGIADHRIFRRIGRHDQIKTDTVRVEHVLRLGDHFSGAAPIGEMPVPVGWYAQVGRCTGSADIIELRPIPSGRWLGAPYHRQNKRCSNGSHWSPAGCCSAVAGRRSGFRPAKTWTTGLDVAVAGRVDDVAGEVVAHVEGIRPLVAIEVARIGAPLLRLHRQLCEKRRVVDALAGHVLDVERRPCLSRLDVRRQALERRIADPLHLEDAVEPQVHAAGPVPPDGHRPAAESAFRG